MLGNKELKTLMTKAATISDGQTLSFNKVDYTKTELNYALRSELSELAGTFKQYKKNKELIFELMEEVVDDVLPERVFDSLNQFVEIKNGKEGDKFTFHRRMGNIRGRNFVTQVAHAGLYEVFKLDREVFDMPTTAYGSAVMISLEEFLEGRVDFAELIQIITEGYEETIYREILRNMVALNSQSILPSNNIRKTNGWDPVGFGSLLGITRSYGAPTIFCSYMFASAMIPHSGMATDGQKQELVDKGFIGRHLGANIVVLPHSFYDTSNTAKAVTIPAGLAWILPTGKEKPIKMAFEGQTQTKEVDNDDWSREIHFYKKMGFMLVSNPGICIYENTSLNEWPAVSGPIISFQKGEQTATFTRLV